MCLYILMRGSLLKLKFNAKSQVYRLGKIGPVVFGAGAEARVTSPHTAHTPSPILRPQGLQGDR
jgi:hypothetical protein